MRGTVKSVFRRPFISNVDLRGKARAVAEEYSEPPGLLFSPVSKPGHIYPGRIVFRPDEESLYVVSFRPTRKGRVKFYEIEGPRAGQWKEVPVEEIGWYYRAVREDVSPAVRNLAPAVTPVFEDGEPRELGAAYPSLMISASLLGLGAFFPTPERLQDPKTSESVSREVLPATVQAVMLLVEAADVASASYDTLDLGQNAYMTIQKLIREILPKAEQFMRMAAKATDTKDIGLFVDLARRVRKFQEGYLKYGFLLGRAYLFGLANQYYDTALLHTEARVLAEQLGLFVSLVDERRDEVLKLVSQEELDRALEMALEFIKNYHESEVAYLKVLDKALAEEGRTREDYLFASLILPWLIRSNEEALSKTAGEIAYRAPSMLLSGLSGSILARLSFPEFEGPSPLRAHYERFRAKLAEKVKTDAPGVSRATLAETEIAKGLYSDYRHFMRSDLYGLFKLLSEPIVRVARLIESKAVPSELTSPARALEIVAKLRQEFDLTTEPKIRESYEDAIAFVRSGLVKLDTQFFEHFRITERSFRQAATDLTLVLSKAKEPIKPGRLRPSGRYQSLQQDIGKVVLWMFDHFGGIPVRVFFSTFPKHMRAWFIDFMFNFNRVFALGPQTSFDFIQSVIWSSYGFTKEQTLEERQTIVNNITDALREQVRIKLMGEYGLWRAKMGDKRGAFPSNPSPHDVARIIEAARASMSEVNQVISIYKLYIAFGQNHWRSLTEFSNEGAKEPIDVDAVKAAWERFEQDARMANLVPTRPGEETTRSKEADEAKKAAEAERRPLTEEEQKLLNAATNERNLQEERVRLAEEAVAATLALSVEKLKEEANREKLRRQSEELEQAVVAEAIVRQIIAEVSVGAQTNGRIGEIFPAPKSSVGWLGRNAGRFFKFLMSASPGFTVPAIVSLGVIASILVAFRLLRRAEDIGRGGGYSPDPRPNDPPVIRLPGVTALTLGDLLTIGAGGLVGFYMLNALIKRLRN